MNCMFQLKSRLHKKLGEVNACLVRYNLLAGIEDLGIVDCNKYFVSLPC